MRIVKILFLLLASTFLCGYFWSTHRSLRARVDDLEVQVAEMEEILQYVHVETGEINGLRGPQWIIEGANVHVRSGYGSTNEDCKFGLPDFPNCEGLTGLGNLIVGYNERFPTSGPLPLEVRTGSHNLVVGEFHSYSSVAGFVAGESNKVIGSHASVCGGAGNSASGWYSSVSGGNVNVASGGAASVSGGQNRVASDDLSWAAGSLLEPN